MLHHLRAVLILNGMKCIQGSTASNRLQYLNTNMFAHTLSSSSTFFYVVNTVICFVLGLGLVFSYSSGLGASVQQCHWIHSKQLSPQDTTPSNPPLPYHVQVHNKHM